MRIRQLQFCDFIPPTPREDGVRACVTRARARRVTAQYLLESRIQRRARLWRSDVLLVRS